MLNNFRKQIRGILKQIYKMQRVYHQEYSTYAANGQSASASGSFNSLGIEIMSSARYVYSINLDDDVTINTWIINQTGNLQCTSNDAEI